MKMALWVVRTSINRPARFEWLYFAFGLLLWSGVSAASAPPLQKKESRLLRAEVCCEALRDLSFAALEIGRPVVLWFGEGAEVFEFDDGARSYVHAFRLPQDGNYYLSIESDFEGSSYRFFRPRLVMLDEHYSVMEDVAPDTDLAKGLLRGRFLRFTVKPRQEVMYLVLFSAQPTRPPVSQSTTSIKERAEAIRSSVRLSGPREVVFKMSPEGRVVVVAKPYKLDFD